MSCVRLFIAVSRVFIACSLFFLTRDKWVVGSNELDWVTWRGCVAGAELTSIVLQLKALGIDDVLHFDFPSPPPALTLARALEVLYALGALDEDAKLAEPLGLQLAEFPLEPMLAKFLLSSGDAGCSQEALSIAVCGPPP